MFLFQITLWSAPADVAPIEVLTFNLQCQNNNTPNDPSDDTFTFHLIASHPSSVSTWNTNIDGINYSGDYDRAYQFGPYSVNGGNLSFTLVDNADLSGTASVVLSPPISCSDTCDTYTIIRTWTATDDCGNTSVENQVVEVEDSEAPTITTPASDLTVNCDGSGNYSDLQTWINNQGGAVAVDGCGSVIWTNDFTNLPSGCSGTGTITVVFTASDDCGNSSQTTADFTITDDTVPYFTAGIPSDVTVECDAIPAPPTIGVDITAGDNCDGSSDVTITFSETSTQTNTGTCSDNNYSLRRVWYVEDQCSNIDSAIQIITVVDTSVPSFTAGIPSDVTVECDAIPTPPTIGVDITAGDNCDGSSDVTITFSETSTQTNTGTCSDNNYSLRRVWYVADQCSNIDSAIQIITVVDTSVPSFTAGIPSDITVECDAIPAPPTIGVDITAGDNCDGSSDVTITFSETSTQTNTGTCSDNNYSLRRVWYVADQCANIDSAIQIITVVDTSVPSFTAGIPSDVTVECDAIPAPPTIGVDITAGDNCDGSSDVTITFSETSTQTNTGTCSDNNYSLRRVWYVADQCSNIDSAIQIITVVDTSVPSFTAGIPSDVTVECDAIPAPPTIGV
ncbi:MAG: hypothetical protein AAFW73_12480, partial [Bacteroidota bacterium]